MPPPHVAEHVPHVVHVLQVQLISLHEVVSQAIDSTDSPVHGVPPFCGVSSTYLDLSCVPPPHVAEQAPHVLHEAQVQFTKLPSSQAVVPQASDTTDTPLHGIPPFCALFSTYLDFSCEPPPHVAEHAPHGVQEAQVQLTKPFSTQADFPDPTEVVVLVIVVVAALVIVVILVVMVAVAKIALNFQ